MIDVDSWKREKWVQPQYNAAAIDLRLVEMLLGRRATATASEAPGLTASTSSDTEIDFSTYMQQVEQFLGGERDYGLIKGDTGPVV